MPLTDESITIDNEDGSNNLIWGGADRRSQNKQLLLSVIESFTTTYDLDPARNERLFFEICKQLLKLGVIDTADIVEENNFVRAAYKRAFHSLLLRAINDVNLASIQPTRALSLASRTASSALSNTSSGDLSGSSSSLENKKQVTVQRADSNDSVSSGGSLSDFVEKPLSRYTEDFVELRRLGKGAFGSVFEARNRLDGLSYAIKKIRLGIQTPKEYTKILREVKFLAHLEHSSIVRYYGAWVELISDGDAVVKKPFTATTDSTIQVTRLNTDDGSEEEDDEDEEEDESDEEEEQDDEQEEEEEVKPAVSYSLVPFNAPKIKLEWPVTHRPKMLLTLFIQMQLCEEHLGSWLERRNSQCRSNSGLTPEDVRDNIIIFRGLVQGVAYLHEQKVIHRDIKPQNIFVNGTKPKIGDFGLSTKANLPADVVLLSDSGEEINEDLTSGIGTSSYASPEQLSNAVYDFKSDVYSLGIILFELFYPVSTGMERAIVFRDLRRGILPREFVSKWAKESALVLWMLSQNPAERPSAKEVLQLELLQLVSAQSRTEQLLEQKDREIEQLRKKITEQQLQIEMMENI